MTRHRSVRLAVALLAIPVLLAACGGSSTPTAASATAAPSAAPPAAPTPVASGAGLGYPEGCPTEQPAALAADDVRNVTITTDKGDIVVEVKGSVSPIATGNFVALAECGYYDGVVFHRLVPGFVIQGGDGEYGRSPNVDPNQVGTGGPPYVIQDEPITAPYMRGTVAMARTPAPNSVGSQFFIVLDDSVASALSSAQYGYQIVGQVTSGMEAVDAIAALPNSGEPSNAAIDPIPMTKVTVATP
jgi:cyclophilin family peptidyl-prolyl cis-trans isomerase